MSSALIHLFQHMCKIDIGLASSRLKTGWFKFHKYHNHTGSIHLHTLDHHIKKKHMCINHRWQAVILRHYSLIRMLWKYINNFMKSLRLSYNFLYNISLRYDSIIANYRRNRRWNGHIPYMHMTDEYSVDVIIALPLDTHMCSMLLWELGFGDLWNMSSCVACSHEYVFPLSFSPSTKLHTLHSSKNIDVTRPNPKRLIFHWLYVVNVWCVCFDHCLRNSIDPIDPSHKSHNASDKYPTVLHFVTEMRTFLLRNSALRDMCLMHCGICEMDYWLMENIANSS